MARERWWEELGWDSALGHAAETAAMMYDRDERRDPSAPEGLYLERAHTAYEEGRIDAAKMEARIERVLQGGWIPR